MSRSCWVQTFLCSGSPSPLTHRKHEVIHPLIPTQLQISKALDAYCSFNHVKWTLAPRRPWTWCRDRKEQILAFEVFTIECQSPSYLLGCTRLCTYGLSRPSDCKVREGSSFHVTPSSVFPGWGQAQNRHLLGFCGRNDAQNAPPISPDC